MFVEDDIKIAKSLLILVNSGSYDMRGEAVTRAASIFAWAANLPDKIEQSIKAQKKNKAPSIRPITPEAKTNADI